MSSPNLLTEFVNSIPESDRLRSFNSALTNTFSAMSGNLSQLDAIMAYIFDNGPLPDLTNRVRVPCRLARAIYDAMTEEQKLTAREGRPMPSASAGAASAGAAGTASAGAASVQTPAPLAYNSNENNTNNSNENNDPVNYGNNDPVNPEPPKKTGGKRRRASRKTRKGRKHTLRRRTH